MSTIQKKKSIFENAWRECKDQDSLDCVASVMQTLRVEITGQFKLKFNSITSKRSVPYHSDLHIDDEDKHDDDDQNQDNQESEDDDDENVNQDDNEIKRKD